MTKTHYTSKDQIVEIVTTTDDSRYPRHKAPMAVIKLKPRAHSRCREQWGGITVMFTHEEVRAVLEAIKTCDPKFEYWLSKASKNKPESRKQQYQNYNRRRISTRRSYV